MSGRAFSLPIPVGFESLNPVADLTDRVGREGPLFAIRLWQHRQRTGALIPGDNAAGAIERHAGWTRKRGVLAAALVASGIVKQTSQGLRIADPFDLGSVEWMGESASTPVTQPRPWLAHSETVYARDGHLCRYCGRAPSRFTLDHVDPKSRGGSHDPANLVTACGSCNSRKGARTPEEAGMALLPIPQPRAQA